MLTAALALVGEATRSPASVGVSVHALSSGMKCIMQSQDMRRILGNGRVENRSARCYVHPEDWSRVSKAARVKTGAVPGGGARQESLMSRYSYRVRCGFVLATEVEKAHGSRSSRDARVFAPTNRMISCSQMQRRLDAMEGVSTESEEVVSEVGGMLPVWKWVETIQTAFPEYGVLTCITRSTHVDYREHEKHHKLKGRFYVAASADEVDILLHAARGMTGGLQGNLDVRGDSLSSDLSAPREPVSGPESANDMSKAMRAFMVRRRTALARSMRVLRPPMSFAEFKMMRLLGRGAFGSVYQACHCPSGRDVAVKIFRTKSVRRRHLRSELYSLSVLPKHPSLLEYFCCVSSSSRIYLVTEYIDGSSLGSLLAGAGRLSEEALRILLAQLLGAIGAAHSRGIVHRDLKPANIMVLDSGVPKCIDWGLADLVGWKEAQTEAEAEAGDVSGSIRLSDSVGSMASSVSKTRSGLPAPGNQEALPATAATDARGGVRLSREFRNTAGRASLATLLQSLSPSMSHSVGDRDRLFSRTFGSGASSIDLARHWARQRCVGDMNALWACGVSQVDV